jgi:hypothetical protein
MAPAKVASGKMSFTSRLLEVLEGLAFKTPEIGTIRHAVRCDLRIIVMRIRKERA